MEQPIIATLQQQLADIQQQLNTLSEHLLNTPQFKQNTLIADQTKLNTEVAALDEAAYNTEAATSLNKVLPLIQKHRRDIASYFYSNLNKEQFKILNLLTEQEHEHLLEKQMGYLEQLFSPSLSLREHKQLATIAGKRHDAVSLPPEQLIYSYQVYRQAIYKFIPALSQHHEAATQIFEQRLSLDMAWQLMGLMEAVETRNHFLKTLTAQLPDIHNPDTLLDFLIEQLLTMEGVSGISIAGFVRKNHLICEKASGLSLHGQECTLSNETRFKDQPILQAWQTEKPVWINSIATQVTDACTIEDANRLSIRSYAIIPVSAASSTPIKLIIVYSKWPGFFLSHDKQFFFESLAQALSNQLNQLSQLDQRQFAQLTLKQRLHYRTLLEKKQVEMVYQPIVMPFSHLPTKLEALARLHDDGKLISPYHFMSAFGVNQLLDLFEVGLEQACITLKKLHTKFSDHLIMSLNLPTEAFSYPNILYRAQRIIQKHDLKPDHFQLEVLESGSLDESQAYNILKQLQRKGFKIALDDVGSGESSLLRMRSLPLDAIKIDQNFIRPLISNLEAVEYVESLIRLSESQHLNCVIEGVEKPELIDLIQTLGHSELQGYGIAKPMHYAELESWLHKICDAAKRRSITNSPFTGYQPKTLHGWYARHLKRARMVLDAVPNNMDMLNFRIASHYEHCPMTPALQRLGLDTSHPLYQAHKAFHDAMHEIEHAAKNDQPIHSAAEKLIQALQDTRQETETILDQATTAIAIHL